MVGAALLVCVMGCEAIRIRATDRLIAPGIDEPFSGASMAQWPADFNRLIYDIPWAIKKLHWGLLGIRQISVDPGPARLATQIVRGAALLPDGRTATIVAWPVNDSTIGVAWRVGHFGDRRQERNFIRCLAQVLRGKPSRKQRQGFELPDPVESVGAVTIGRE